MKRIMIALASILIIGLVAVVSATAEPISKRLHRQKMRIHQGVDSGALTGPERHRLMHQHRNIRRLHRRAWYDGYLSNHERRFLHLRLDRASRQIHRLKHNEKWAKVFHPSHHGPGVWYQPKGAWDR